MTISFPSEALRLFIRLISGDNNAFNTLVEKGYKNLAITNVTLNGDDDSLDWLIKHDEQVLAAFVMACFGEKKSFRYLMENKAFHWAATANAVNEDDDALQWLRQHKLTIYAELAEAIKIKFKREAVSTTKLMHKGPF